MSSFKDYENFINQLKVKIDNIDFNLERKDFGRVISVGDGIALVDGLAGVGLGEAVSFLNDGIGIVMGLDPSFVSIILLNYENELYEGVEVFRTKKTIEIPVGEGLIGRVISPLGEPLDGRGPITNCISCKIDARSPGITERSSVCEPLQTGIKAIDALIPIGLGQRQLILGDRQSGKTSIAIDTIINQKNVKNFGYKFAYCVYVAIGQKASDVAKLYELLKASGAMEYSVLVVTTASDAAAMQYIAPMSGAAVGEYFRDKGQDAVVIFDDLSKHADIYRQISLLMRRYPARGAYPGDVFYLHAKLLERAAKLNDANGGGSLTMLPIIETQAGDLSAYIPTNVISITDGQINLDKRLFFEGQRPAVNIGFSVSRIGSAAQYKGMRKVAGRLKGELAQFREYEDFAKSVSDLDQDTKNALKRGRVLVNLFNQELNHPLSFEKMILSLFAGVNGLLDDVPKEKIADFERNLFIYMETSEPEILESLIENRSFDDAMEDRMKKSIKHFLSRYQGLK
jgi:F-type H+-transporting ATPase subunit alpha